MKLLERCIERAACELIILAPAASEIPECFRCVSAHGADHTRLLEEAQTLRGKTYLEDGAIEARELTPDGRYEQPVDGESWHILALDAHGRVRGCVRYRLHRNVSFHDLGVSGSALAKSPVWGWLLRMAVNQELAGAWVQELAYAEVGAWAIAPERRGTPEALRTALSVYALAGALGGSRGITTATQRHHSSSILRRIGGQPLSMDGIELPPYYDPRYRCDMEILQFDSRSPSSIYAAAIERLRASLAMAPVVCRQKARAEHEIAAPWLQPETIGGAVHDAGLALGAVAGQ